LFGVVVASAAGNAGANAYIGLAQRGHGCHLLRRPRRAAVLPERVDRSASGPDIAGINENAFPACL
jgi:hypothetical protein